MERGRPVPGLGLGRAGVAALALFALVLGACDGGEAEETPTATATASPPTATVDAAQPQATPANPPWKTPWVQQVVIFDLAERSFSELLPPLPNGDDRYVVDEFFPRFTPDGLHVWISEREAQLSRRYDIAGEVAEELPGLLVDESSAGSLTYVRDVDGDLTQAVRLQGTEYLLPRANPGEVALSPDGERVAYRRVGPGETFAYEIADVRTGEVVATATKVGVCRCDGGASPGWSASGRYFLFGDYPSPIGNAEDPEQGTFALDTTTGARTLLTLNPWVGAGAALGQDRFLAEREGALVVIEGASGAALRTVTPTESGVRFDAAGGVVATYEVSRDPFHVFTKVYDLESGSLLHGWDGQARPIAAGDAVAYELQESSASSGTSLIHPLLTQPAELPSGLVLAPDGRHVAVLDGNRVVVHDVANDGLQEVASYELPSDLFNAGVYILPVEWNEQSTHLLIAVGFGL